LPPSKSRNSSPLTEGRKEVISTTTRALQVVTYPAHPFLRNAARESGEKTQNTNYSGTLNQKQLQMCKYQCRMNQQDNSSSSKANSTTKDQNICVEEELSNNEFQKQ
jgi:hypothetical protein